MIHAIIIDDELNGLKSLQLLIEKFVPDVKVVAATTDPVQGIELINNYRPDIVFLDINMPNLNGFELLAKLDFKSFYLIFTTAHREYGLKAIKLRATDYLLKPIDQLDLNQAVERIKSNIAENQKLPDVFNILREIYEVQEPKLFVSTKTAIEYVAPNTIAYIEAISNHSALAFTNGSMMTVNKALKDYELQLCNKDTCFIRIHNSFIINMNYVTQYMKEESGYAVMQNKKLIPISKYKKEAFLKWINFNPEM